MKYRIKTFDLMNDIWLLQKRTMLIFWMPCGCGKKAEVQKKCDELNSEAGGAAGDSGHDASGAQGHTDDQAQRLAGDNATPAK